MRNLAIDPVQGRAGVRSCSWCLGMFAALVLAPVAASARAPSPDVPPTQEPDAEQPTAEPAFEPVDIPPPTPAPAPLEPPPPEPAPIEPAPIEPALIEGPSESEGSSEQRPRIQERKASIGVVAASGVLSGIGLGLTISFTILGDAAQRIETPQIEDIERNDTVARVGGVLIASGVALAAVGGIVFVHAERRAKEGTVVARVRVVPALGGLVFSGRF
jgi:hypothetical protein